MARARNLKPGLLKNEILGVADPLLTILFEGLWLLADREGRLEDRPLRIKAEVLPYRDGIDMDAMLNWLQSNGFILRYEVQGKRYILVLEFVKHQNPHKNEPESVIPAPEQIGTTPEIFGSAPADSLSTDSLSTDSTTVDSPDGESLACPVEEIIAMYHEAMPDNPRVKVANVARRGVIKARWKEAARLDCKPFGYRSRADGIAAWRAFFETCSESAFLTGRSTPRPGAPPFLADIDFLLSPSGFTKCLENKYHRETA